MSSNIPSSPWLPLAAVIAAGCIGFVASQAYAHSEAETGTGGKRGRTARGKHATPKCTDGSGHSSNKASRKKKSSRSKHGSRGTQAGAANRKSTQANKHAGTAQAAAALLPLPEAGDASAADKVHAGISQGSAVGYEVRNQWAGPGGVRVHEIWLRGRQRRVGGNATGDGLTFGLILKDDPNVTVRKVEPQSFAMEAGVQIGWLITMVNGVSVGQTRDVKSALLTVTVAYIDCDISYASRH